MQRKQTHCTTGITKQNDVKSLQKKGDTSNLLAKDKTQTNAVLNEGSLAVAKANTNTTELLLS
jgi:hypothetical protein